MRYETDVIIELKSGMLDPEGTTIKRALEHLGYTPESVNTAKKYTITLDSDNIHAARENVEEMCQKLIANPIIHNYSITLREI
ncbi:phosphoribosylformylglycinamidine synthase, purS protein [Methanomethylovorans hollandica DSM 15978]|uniref:Phosphoribosylformylglycinamidine synthase subunit PurS n=1 Tax=Methanomethylovorans hollandica (strain DSM 15978 / NBRC 107637 / DMS1) TaxID=867904 RepID=L0KV39_METHD|nr:phosphoribosylformylglycinamidine synthase subunit PurS [Methanomethylovorans hollandica]AGB49287.1 phosphoribosylformylglycinamidine synthase, purS protein [Methanomethylovorans hollandica DSM 15978]